MGLVNTWSSLHRDLHKNRLCSGNSGHVHRSRDCRYELRRWRRQAWASLTKNNCEGARDVGWRCEKDVGSTMQFQSWQRWQRCWYCPPSISQHWGCGSKHWSCVNLLNFYSTLSWWVLFSSLFWQMRNLENREVSNWPSIAWCQSQDECTASKAPGLMLPTMPGREGTAFRRKETWTWLLDLFVTSSVTLGKSCDFSVFSPIKKTTPTHLLQNYW